MLTGQKLTQTLKNIPLKAEQGYVYRFVGLRFQNTLLSAVGSRINGGRYNDQQFEALYTSGSPITALREIRFLLDTVKGVVAFPGEPSILLSLNYRLQSILDITDPNTQAALNTNLQELTGTWAAYIGTGKIAPTQELGNAAYNLGIQALKVPSSVDLDPNSFNLVIFPDRLNPNGLIEVYDPSGTIQLKLP